MGYEIVVFLGPTLSVTEAQTHLDALFLPPAGNGDLVRAVIDHAPRAIVLVDGVFAQSPAVRHKEILWAISRGVRVYGASSMGAIRAAELEAHGMVGYGMVFRWYRRTPLADDADVAVPMAPAQLGSFPLGNALIDMRLTLNKARRAGVIAPHLAMSLAVLARRLHYSDRSYAKLLSIAVENGAASQDLRALELWLAEGKRKQKEADAIGLLTYLALNGTPPAGDMEMAGFEPTEAFAYDMAYYDLAHEVLAAADR